MAECELTLVQTRVTFLLNDAVYSLRHALLLAVSSYVHLALDGDVRVGDGSGEQLAQRAQEESHGGCRVPLAPRLVDVLHLLEERVLQDGIDDEHQRGDDAAEQGLRPLLTQQRHQRAQGRGGLGPGLLLGRDGAGAAALDHDLLRRLKRLAPRRHPRVDDPDRVRQDHGGGARERARHHRFYCCELLGGAPRAEGGGLEEGARPLVPVVVDEVGHADPEDGAVEPRVEAGYALARYDALHGG